MTIMLFTAWYLLGLCNTLSILDYTEEDYSNSSLSVVLLVSLLGPLTILFWFLLDDNIDRWD